MNLQDLFEVSLGDYSAKATKSKALAQMNKAFGYPGNHDTTIGAREKGLARASARHSKAMAARTAQAQADSLAADKANLPAMQQQLKQLTAQFDPNYEYSDDYSFWSEQKGIAAQIAGLKNRIARAQA